MRPPSGDQIELTLGAQRAVVVSVGAGVREYVVGERPVLDGYDSAAMCTSGRGQLLIPWPNRIADGRYEFGGRVHQLPLNEPERGNAIHGLVRWSEWLVSHRDSRRAVLEHVLYPSPGYPYTLALRVEHSLSEHGLTVEVEATNVGAETSPYAAGAHPYLAVAGDDVDRAALRVPARTVLRSDERGLPVGAEALDGGELDFRVPRPIGTAKLDHCFTDLERGPDGRARVGLAGGAAVWLDEAYPYVMVFSGDGLPDVERRSLAIEPMTAAPNAFVSGDGLIALAPSESHRGTWGISP